ncbi:MAG: hypothetical protein ACTHW2_11950 [Tissierella sp.]|uniref:hypothetical protein n=1 Tax=Tissierella sp. TaxID=41274 RepID=UPI003F98B48B
MEIVKRMVIIIIASFIFNIIFGVILSRKPDLFLPIQKKIKGSSARNKYKLLFFLVAALLVVFLNEYFNVHEIVALSILGLSLSLSGIVFRDIKK